MITLDLQTVGQTVGRPLGIVRNTQNNSAPLVQLSEQVVPSYIEQFKVRSSDGLIMSPTP
jgi:hypothetical protein